MTRKEKKVDAFLKSFPPGCEAGYPISQLQEHLVPEKFNKLMEFMRGQTMTICDGRIYDHDKRKYIQTNCGPHGGVIYASDFKRFLMGWPVLDW